MNSKTRNPFRFSPQQVGEHGFTFIEMVIVIVMIGLLAASAIQKLVSMTKEAEIAAENATIEILRSNLLTVLGEALLKYGDANFPENPLDNLSKVPQGYDPSRKTKPTGLNPDNSLWAYVLAKDTDTLTPKEAGTTLETFTVDGYIYHQRKDSIVVRWAYDSSTGVISNKFLVSQSELQQALERIVKSEKEES